MERLDELSSGVRGQTTGKDMDHPPVASPTMADQAVPLSDVPRALFDAPWETLVHLSPAIRWEQDPTLSEFISHSQDLLPGVPLCRAPPISALKLRVQMQCHLDAEPDFAVDFCPPSPVASNQILRLPDGRWELNTSIQTAMVKISAQMVTCL